MLEGEVISGCRTAHRLARLNGAGESATGVAPLDLSPGGIIWAHAHSRIAEDTLMTITWSLAPLLSLIAGVLILVMPRLLSYIVAAYLIVFGLLGLFGDAHLA